MDNHQSSDGAAPQMPPAAVQMPLDLSVYNDENDYFNAAKCNYILQRAQKNKDDIAAMANRNITKIVEDMRLKIQQELQNLGKLQAGEVNEATKKLSKLNRSQLDIDRAQAYLVGRTSPGIGSHGELRERMNKFEASVKELLGIPSEYHYSKPVVATPAASKPVVATPAASKTVPPASTSAPPILTPSVGFAENQQPKPLTAQAPKGLTLSNAKETGFNPRIVVPSATPAPQVVSSGPTKAVPASLPKKLISPANPFAKGMAPVNTSTGLAYTPTAAAPPGNKSHMPHPFHKTESTSRASTMPPPTNATNFRSKKTIHFNQLVPYDYPIKIDGIYHVLRCPDHLIKVGFGDGVNPVRYPAELFYDAIAGRASLHGTSFTLSQIMEHLALRVVISKGRNVREDQLWNAGFVCDHFYESSTGNVG
ncbi:hypothetical protein PG989_011868 [Apiospora arundinis]